MRHMVFAVLALTLVVTGGCVIRMVQGSGEIVTEVREVPSFERLALSNTGRVVLRHGDSQSLKVTADDNLIEYIDTEVVDGTLRLGLSQSGRALTLRPSTTFVYEVTYTELTGLSVSGSGSIDAARLETPHLEVAVSGSGEVMLSFVKADQLTVAISGSGDVEAAGEAGTVSIAVSGSGTLDASGLEASRAAIVVSGSGDVGLAVKDDLEVRISGSGSVRYWGKPYVTESVSGTGRLVAMDGGVRAL